MQANSQLLTAEMPTSTTGKNHDWLTTEPIERTILMSPLSRMSVCEPLPGSVERIGFRGSGPSRAQFIPQCQPRPVRLLRELVALGREERVWQQNRELLLAGAVEQP